MFDFIYRKLQEIKRKKQHEVLQLKWQKAELEKKLKELQENS